MADIQISLGLEAGGFRASLVASEETADKRLDAIGAKFTKLQTTVSAASAKMQSDFTKALADIRAAAQNLNFTASIGVKVNTEGTKQAKADVDSLLKSLSQAQQDIGRAKLQNAQGRGLVDRASSEGPTPAILRAAKAQLKDIEATLERLRARPLDLKAQREVNNLSRLAAKLREVGQIDPTPRARFQLSTLNQEFQKFGGIIRNISTVLSTIGVGGGIFALIYGFKRLVGDGLEFNAAVERAHIAIGASVAATAQKISLDGEQYTGLAAIEAVQGNINVLIDQLKRDALFVSGTFTDLLDVTTSMIPVVLRLGGSLQDVERLTRLTGIAASVYGLNFKVATNGVIQLLNGTINKRNELTKRLPVESFDALKKGLGDVGTRLSFVTEQLGKLQNAAPLLEKSYTATLESVKDLTQQIFGETFAPLQARLQKIFTNLIDESLVKNADGAAKFSDAMKGSLDQGERIVRNLVAQVAVLVRQLFGTPNQKSFLDTIEENLPTLVNSLFSVATAVKGISDVLTANGSVVLKVIGYFLGFQLVRGIIVSLAGVVTNFGRSMAAVVETAGDAREKISAFATVAREGTVTTQTFSAVLGGLGTILKGLGFAAVVALVIEFASSLIQARADATSFKLALNDLNNLNFDGAINELRRLEQATRELGITKSLGDQAADAKQVAEIVTASQRAMEKAAKAAGVATGKSGLDTARSILTELPALRAKAIAEAQRATTEGARKAAVAQAAAFDSSRAAADNYLASVATAGRVFDTVTRSTKGTSQKVQQKLGGTAALAQAKKESESLRALEVEVEVANRRNARIETLQAAPSAKKAEKGGAARVADARKDILNAFKAELDARLQAADRAFKAEDEALDTAVAQRRLTEQDAAAQSIDVASRLYATRLGLLSNYFEEVRRIAGDKVVKEFGVVNFEDLIAVDAEGMEKKLREFSVRALSVPQTEDAKAATDATIDSVRRLIEMRRVQQNSAEELVRTEGRAARDTASADASAAEFRREQNSENLERLALAKANSAANRQGANDLNRLIEQERALGVARVNAVSAKAGDAQTKELGDISKRQDITDIEKANLVIQRSAAIEAQRLANIRQEELATVSAIAAAVDNFYRSQAQLLSIDETRADTLGEIVGQESLAGVRQREQIKYKKSLLALAESQTKQALAQEALDRGDSATASQLSDEARALFAISEQFRVNQLNYVQTVATQITALQNTIEKFSGIQVPFLGQLGAAAEAFGGLQKLREEGGIGQAFSAGKGGSTGALGALKGGISIATGPVGEAVSAALGLLTSFFDRLNAGYKKLLEDSSKRISKQIDATLGDLRNKRATTGSTISDLQNQLSGVDGQFAAKLTTNKALLAASPIAFFASFLSNRKANAERDKAIKEARERIQQELESLQQDAREALQKLELDVLPVLRVSPDIRQFTEAIRELRVEIADYLSLPEANEANINELFNLRVIDLQRSAQDALTQAKQDYLALVRDEAQMQRDLVSLDRDRASAATDFQRQRAELLGYAVREETRGQRLRTLELEQQERLADIDNRRQELVDRLSYVQQETALYAEQFGVIQNARQYELEISQQILARTNEGLVAVRQTWDQISQIVRLTASQFTALQPAALAGLGAAPVSPSVVSNVTIGTINIGEGNNVTPSDVRQSVLDGLRELAQLNSLKGTAFAT